ncbi:ATP-binding protein [Bradyrhizobium cosmicum]|uniref:ATP-binding protein n=1 Tax=Bradyrhizobium cosmicum TaxID=1404864 RepID=UPI00396563FA
MATTYHDWGSEPLTADQRRDLFEIVDDRYDKGSLLITSQVPVSQWHDVIADTSFGDAMLDRINHNAHRIELEGDSLRRQAGEKKKPWAPRARSPRRPPGPSRARRYVARGALRAAHGALPRPLERSSDQPASVDAEAISSTLKPVTRVRLRT